MRASATVIGPCPTPGCGGEIVERSELRLHRLEEPTEPGCGFVIWKKPRGKREMTSRWRGRCCARRELPRPRKEPIGDCPTPDCGGKIVENSRAFGCT